MRHDDGESRDVDAADGPPTLGPPVPPTSPLPFSIRLFRQLRRLRVQARLRALGRGIGFLQSVRHSPPDSPPDSPPSPFPQRTNRESRPRLIVGVSVATVLVVVCAGTAALLYATVSARIHAPREVDASATSAAAAPRVLFQAALTPDSLNAQDWDFSDHCFLGSDGLHVRDNYICYVLPVGRVGDIDASVEVRQVSGTVRSPYGIAVRRAAVGNFYFFGVDSGGNALIQKCDTAANASTSDCRALTPYTANANIERGLKAVNRLDVKAIGAHFTFTVNGSFVAYVTDSAFASGLVALGGSAPGMEEVFSNLKITTAA